jgi:S-adenosylmethionine hydrolase
MKIVEIGIETKTKVYGLKSSIQSFGVIVGFTVLKNSLDYLKGLSVFEEYTMFDNIKSEIQCLRMTLV